jgi:CHAT domain-containing protein/Tfp pilus assembly protein PilF
MFHCTTNYLSPNVLAGRILRWLAVLSLALSLQVGDGLNAEAGRRQSPAIQSQRHESGSASRNVQEAPTALELGLPLTRELHGGETHRYQIMLAQGQYASVSLEQRGIDVVVELAGPDDQLISVFDDEVRSLGEERIEFVAEAAGEYKLAVKAKLKNVPAGHYEIRPIEEREATDRERALHQTRLLQTQISRLFRAGKYDEVRPLIERALGIAEGVLGPDDVYVARLIEDLGHVYFSKRDHAKATTAYERALTIFQRQFGTDHPETAAAMLALGSSYLIGGEYPKADPLLTQSLRILEKTLGAEHPALARSLDRLGVLYQRRGELEKSEESYRRAVMILEKAQDTDTAMFAGLLVNLAHHYHQRRDYEGAEELLLRSLAITERLLGADHPWVADSLINLGITARARKDYDSAEKYYLRGLSIKEKAVGPEAPDVAQILNSIANLYRSKGEYDKALEVNLRAVSILEKTAGPYEYATVLSLGSIARTYAAMGDLANAIKYQSRVDAVIERAIELNLTVGSERQKLAFLNTVSWRTDRTISLNMQSAPNDPEASALAALVVLQRKGRVLDALSETRAALRERSDSKGRVLLDALNGTTAQLAGLLLNGPPKTSPEDQRKLVKELEQKKEKLEAEISLRSAEFRAQTQPVTLWAVQAAIPKDAALVEFAAYHPFNPKAESDSEAGGETRYAAYVVRREGTPLGRDLGEANAIDAAVDRLRQALRDPSRRDVREIARSLDEQIMRPVRALAGDATRLLVSPDGALNLIPFEALVDERGGYLIQRYSFAYLTSGRDLLRFGVARESRSQPVVVADPAFGEPATVGVAAVDGRAGDGKVRFDQSQVFFGPLPGVAAEVRALRKLLPQATFLTREQATKSALMQVHGPSILHIATHGFFLQNDPRVHNRPRAVTEDATRLGKMVANVENPLLRSGLALAGANQGDIGSDDGVLTALEAAQLDLWGTKLVVLSACDTGVGEVRSGEGVYGLRRALVLAGAESQVMSLWPVSDRSTRDLMVGYYKGLSQNEGRGDALRRAQLQMLRGKAHSHPYYWASFILAGEWGNLKGLR